MWLHRRANDSRAEDVVATVRFFHSNRGFSPVIRVASDTGSRFNGNNILDSSAEPLCLFVIPGSCDFVVWFS